MSELSERVMQEVKRYDDGNGCTRRQLVDNIVIAIDQASRVSVGGVVATVDAPSSKREIIRLVDAIEQSIRGLSQPLSPMETATRIKIAAEYGLTYVAALRERLSTDYAATASPAAPKEEARSRAIFDAGFATTPSPDAAREAAEEVGRAIINGLPEDNIEKITQIIRSHCFPTGESQSK